MRVTDVTVVLHAIRRPARPVSAPPDDGFPRRPPHHHRRGRRGQRLSSSPGPGGQIADEIVGQIRSNPSSRTDPAGSGADGLDWCIVTTPPVPARSAPLLAITGLRRSFGDVAVLSGVDAEVRPGEAVAVVGPNGSGKTTLLRCIASTDRPSAGSIRLCGRPLRERDPQTRRGVAAVLDDVEFFADLAVAEHLALLMSAHGDRAPIEHAADLLAEVGLADAADQLPAGLSERAAATAGAGDLLRPAAAAHPARRARAATRRDRTPLADRPAARREERRTRRPLRQPRPRPGDRRRRPGARPRRRVVNRGGARRGPRPGPAATAARALPGPRHPVGPADDRRRRGRSRARCWSCSPSARSAG